MSSPTQRKRAARLSVEIPGDLHDLIRQGALDERTTVKALVGQTLAAEFDPPLDPPPPPRRPKQDIIRSVWQRIRRQGACERWKVSFEAFYADMEPTWQYGRCFMRIDKTRDYEPGNCRWAGMSEVSKGRRKWVYGLDPALVAEVRRHTDSVGDAAEQGLRLWLLAKRLS